MLICKYKNAPTADCYGTTRDNQSIFQIVYSKTAHLLFPILITQNDKVVQLLIAMNYSAMRVLQNNGAWLIALEEYQFRERNCK